MARGGEHGRGGYMIVRVFHAPGRDENGAPRDERTITFQIVGHLLSCRSGFSRDRKLTCTFSRLKPLLQKNFSH